jgi:pyruvate carboxylase
MQHGRDLAGATTGRKGAVLPENKDNNCLIPNPCDQNRCAQSRSPTERLERSLAEFAAVGIKTTLPLHQRIVAGAAFRAGDYDIHWLERLVTAA